MERSHAHIHTHATQAYTYKPNMDEWLAHTKVSVSLMCIDAGTSLSQLEVSERVFCVCIRESVLLTY